MKALIAYPLVQVEVERDVEEIRTLSPRREPNPTWTLIDSHGHGHFWKDGGLPTLYEKVVGSTWVGDEIDGDEVPITEFRCRSCDEKVEPGYRMNHEPTIIEHPPIFTVTFLSETPVEVYHLTGEIYRQSIKAWREWIQKATCR